MTRSAQLFEEAKRYIPGGVNSPVRAFSAIGSCPRFIAKADGAYLTDADGNRYIDYVCSWGPMILGHNRREIREAVTEAAARGLSYGAATEIEVEMARMVCGMVPGVEMVRMVNSGTEAVMSAIRAARGYTGRDKIVKFNGCYHGHSDCLLVQAGSGVMTAGLPGSAGVPAGSTADTLTAEYNDLGSVETLFQANPGAIACVVVEPVAANMGVVPPGPGFLQGLRRLCVTEVHPAHQARLIQGPQVSGILQEPLAAPTLLLPLNLSQTAIIPKGLSPFLIQQRHGPVGQKGRLILAIRQRLQPQELPVLQVIQNRLTGSRVHAIHRQAPPVPALQALQNARGWLRELHHSRLLRPRGSR